MSRLQNLFNKHWFLLGIFALTLVAAILRFYQLGQVPHGMTWDEAAIGYNGFAVFNTRRDEWLVRLPVSFQSFGDYKAPLSIYLNGAFTHFLGMTLWAVRFPFALASTLAIPGVILLTAELLHLTGMGSSEDLKQNQTKVHRWALFVGLLMTFSPWQLHFARIAFESGMMLSFIIWGCWCLCKLLNQTKPVWKQSFLWTFGTVLMFAAALYTYHSAKLFLPLMLLVFVVLFRRSFWQKKLWIGLAGVSGLIALWPMIKDTLWASGGERFTQATVAGLPISLREKIVQVIEHFFVHLSPQFLVMGATTTLRHGDGHWGVLLLPTFALVILGVIFGLFNLTKWLWSYTSHHTISATARFCLIAVFWILIGLIPAAMGRDVPHSNRALTALPGFLFLASWALFELIPFLEQTKLNQHLSGSKHEENLLVKSVLGLFFLLYFFLSLQYLRSYYTVFAADSAKDFTDGYLQAAQFAAAEEPNSDKILFTSKYGQPYIFLLFVRKTNPIWYRGGSLIKYEFTDQIKQGDLDRNKTTIVATPDEIDPKFADEKVYGSDGAVRFVLVKPKQQ